VDDLPNDPKATPPGTRWVNRFRYSTQMAAAMEVPFTIVGATFFGGFIGYLLDKWLHTDPWLMAVFGAFGFIGGTREVIRRLAPRRSGSSDGSRSG
jgi:F0F1-type ATP synthase assembly protein I